LAGSAAIKPTTLQRGTSLSLSASPSRPLKLESVEFAEFSAKAPDLHSGKMGNLDVAALERIVMECIAVRTGGTALSKMRALEQ
jgi:hypothetical protein